jgi:oligosaccharyltransferase complex subunit beta
MDVFLPITDLYTDRGFETTVESPKSTTLSLFRHGERAYDHVILLPGKAKGLGPALTANQFLDFMKKEGNVVVGLSSDSGTPSSVQSLLLELEIHTPSDKGALIVDHFNYDSTSAAEKHDVLLLPFPNALRSDVRNFFAAEGLLAIPRAVGQTLGNDSPLVMPVLRAPSTAYSYNPKDEADIVEDPFATGEQLNIVSSMQAHNSARFTVIGSAEMLQDAWFLQDATLNGKAVKTANRVFAQQITAWTFKESGVLKLGKVLHYQNEGQNKKLNTSVAVPENNPKIYRVKEDVVSSPPYQHLTPHANLSQAFQIEVSEWKNDHLAPFFPASNDNIQLEFSMLSPFHRLNLNPIAQTANSTIWGVSFKTPDQHGIFNFRINYRRPFLTNIDEKRQVTVRHFAHDEWPRSWQINGAWPWIGGIWVTVGGFVAFVAVWLYSAPTEKTVKKTQ